MLYFNPRSHEGSDKEAEEIYKQGMISIHAPTRGATKTPRKGIWRGLDFNPRSHEGSDRFLGGAEMEKVISIHAPTRGATQRKRAELLDS